MALADPSDDAAEAVSALDALAEQGFVGMRFNPGLQDRWMVGPTGKALYSRCGELGWPVGVMCFKGLLPQLSAINALLDSSPETALILDHFGFFRQPATGGHQGDAAPTRRLARGRRDGVGQPSSRGATIPPHPRLR